MTSPIKTVLTYAKLVEMGIPESDPAVMLFEGYKIWSLPARLNSKSAASLPPAMYAEYRSLQAMASKARRRLMLRDDWVAYYGMRQTRRDMGGDPDTIPRPARKATLQPIAPSVAVARAELAMQPLRDVTLVHPGSRSADAQYDRQLVREQNARILKARKAIEQERRATEKLAVKATATAQKLAAAGSEWAVDAARAALSLRGELRRQQSWSERVMADQQLLGERLPRAKRHLAAHDPMHLRPHHPTSD